MAKHHGVRTLPQLGPLVAENALGGDGAVAEHAPHVHHEARVLLRELDARNEAGVHKQVLHLGRLDEPRRVVQEAKVGVGQLGGDGGVLRRDDELFAAATRLPQPDELVVVVASHRLCAYLARELHDGGRVGALCDQIAQEYDLVARGVVGQPEQLLELMQTAVHVADDDETGRQTERAVDGRRHLVAEVERGGALRRDHTGSR